MNDQEPLAAAGDAGSLQLDRAEYAENAPERCAGCGQALGGSYYEVGGRVCCAACRDPGGRRSRARRQLEISSTGSPRRPAAAAAAASPLR